LKKILGYKKISSSSKDIVLIDVFLSLFVARGSWRCHRAEWADDAIDEDDGQNTIQLLVEMYLSYSALDLRGADVMFA
jgi:hypothetical protein